MHDNLRGQNNVFYRALLFKLGAKKYVHYINLFKCIIFQYIIIKMLYIYIKTAITLTADNLHKT